MNDKIKIGISACLIGEKVRYNGGHKWDRFLTDTLGQYVEYMPVCPEVECGMGIPRETLRLTGNPANPRLVTSRTNLDHTAKMKTWAQKRLLSLEKEDLCGFIFKSDSPSSGMARVKVYNDKGIPEKKGIGIFAREFMNHFPRIPVEEDGRLHDLDLRENFIENIFTLKKWRETLRQPKKIRHLIDFHTCHKLFFLSRSNAHYRQMGKLLARASELAINEAYHQYESLMTEALALKATVKKNMNVFYHIMGYFKKNLTADEKSELIEVMNHYRDENIPLIVPVTLLNHYVRKYNEPYLAEQTYLNPHPIALKLRNHA